jgi:hypothetical protein
VHSCTSSLAGAIKVSATIRGPGPHPHLAGKYMAAEPQLERAVGILGGPYRQPSGRDPHPSFSVRCTGRSRQRDPGEPPLILTLSLTLAQAQVLALPSDSTSQLESCVPPQR